MLEKNETERYKTINSKPEVSNSDFNNSETTLPGATNLRRQRYERHSSPPDFVSLTPVRVKMLRLLAELRFLSLPQIAKLCCPSTRQDLSEKSARRHMRSLFDAGLVDVLPISRAALAPTDALNDASLLYGSAPNVYVLTACGLETLHRAGLIDLPSASRKKPTYGPRNSLFLAHELAVRDMYVWLHGVADSGGHVLETWHDGETAAISSGRTSAPLFVRPDAWFVLRLQQAVLVGLVEVDRGTERGDRRWQEKLTTYHGLFAGLCLREATGYVNGRVLVVCPTVGRRDHLADLIARNAEPALAARFWLSVQAMLDPPNLTGAVWQRPGSPALQPLVNPAVLGAVS